MTIIEDFVKLFFPTYCAGCDAVLLKNETGICLSCQTCLPRILQHDYRDNKLEKKFWGRADIQTATAFLNMSKEGIVRRIIHDLKYHGNKNAGLVLGNLFGAELCKSSSMNQFDYLMPVPLHPKRLLERGYNQCDCIVEGMSQSMEIPISKNHLVRSKYNLSQTKNGKYNRWENVEGIFSVQRANELEGCHVLLIDDIITTGSTIEACAAELTKIKDLKLSVASIAMTEI